MPQSASILHARHARAEHLMRVDVSRVCACDAAGGSTVPGGKSASDGVVSVATSGPATFLADTRAHLCGLLERHNDLDVPLSGMFPLASEDLLVNY